ncbi:MAG: zf-HC2 domain-containing protein [Nitrospirae bacterium]|nr:zf-HC2 domain-containing protein [Nitrospirota bacterium]
MKAKTGTRRSTRRSRHDQHGHTKAQCLNILKNLSAYFDDDLPVSVCGEIRKHLGACPNCEVFVESLRQTVTLCRHHEAHPLSTAEKVRLKQDILRAAGAP